MSGGTDGHGDHEPAEPLETMPQHAVEQVPTVMEESEAAAPTHPGDQPVGEAPSADAPPADAAPAVTSTYENSPDELLETEAGHDHEAGDDHDVQSVVHAPEPQPAYQSKAEIPHEPENDRAHEPPSTAPHDPDGPDMAGHPDGGSPPNYLEDEATTIVQVSPETDTLPNFSAPNFSAPDFSPPTYTTPDYLADEATTIVTAEEPRREASWTEPPDILDDEATTIVQPPAGDGYLIDEPTTLVQPRPHATPPAKGFLSPEELPYDYLADEATTIVAVPDARDPADLTQIMEMPEPAGSGPAEAGNAWFDSRLRGFTEALAQDEHGVGRAPEERLTLAASARDMIARLAMTNATVQDSRAADVWAPDNLLQPGQLLANTYIVRSLIARGGIGEIYRTRHRDLRTEHAIKILLPKHALDPTVLTLMLEESRLLQTVRHEAVVGCQDLLRDSDGRPMLVMDYVRGRTLSSRLREARPTPDQLVALTLRLADGLAAIHAAGIVHQDVSPDNVILAEDSFSAATIIDFGLARTVGDTRDMHRNLDFAGKFSWSSPEQLSGRAVLIDARSDLYSLGLMLAAAARGYRLEMGYDLETARAARTTVPSLAGIDQPMAGLLERLLAPSPADRLGSANEIAGLLKRQPAPGMLGQLRATWQNIGRLVSGARTPADVSP